MTALAQTAPGAIAVNGAILVGRRIAGISGLIVAVLATILPPIVIISIISMMYAAFAENEWVRAVLTGMQSGVAAVICDVTANLGGKVVQSKDWLNLLLMAGAFVASAVFHVNVIVVILVAAAIGVIRALLARKGAYPHDGAVPRLFPNRAVQCRRRICCHAADSVAGRGIARLADDGRIYEPNDDCRDDPPARLRSTPRHSSGCAAPDYRGRSSRRSGASRRR